MEIKCKVVDSVIFLVFLSCPLILAVDQTASAKNGPVVLSPVALTNLARAEQDIHEYMLELYKNLEEQLNLVNDWIIDYEDSSVAATEIHNLTKENDTNGRTRARFVANHPFLTFRMMRRYAHKILPIEESAKVNHEAKFSNKLKTLQSGRQWPGKQQLEDVLASVFRVQSMYSLSVPEMADGIFQGVSTSVRLSIGQCYEIASFGLHYDYFTLALDWFLVTKEKIKQALSQGLTPEVEENVIQDGLQVLVSRHDHNWQKYFESSNYYIFKNKIGEEPVEEKDSRFQKSISYNVTELNPYPSFEESHLNFMALCNGETLLPVSEGSRLFCWLDHNSHPYWTIGGLKMEWLYFDPPVVQAYDFLGPEFMKKLRHLAVPLLDQPPPIKDEYTTPRSAMYAWMTDEEYPIIEPFIRKIEYVSGLNAHGMKASTPLQVASYAFGGYVATHWDSFGEDTDDPKGDRLMTALFYLNEVKQGGLTAFPLLGISVKPVYGSGVFWYLARRDGTVDRRMLHGACPVILGEKWIATKWIHQNENFRRWPCALESDAVTIR